MENRSIVIIVIVFLVFQIVYSSWNIVNYKEEIKTLKQEIDNALLDDNILNNYVIERTKNKEKETTLIKELNNTNALVLKLEKQIRCQRAVLSKLEKGSCENEKVYEKYKLDNFSY